MFGGPILNVVNRLDDMRSTIVHGDDMQTMGLLRTVGSLSEFPGSVFGEGFLHAVDLLRDLVRRSLLVLACGKVRAVSCSTSKRRARARATLASAARPDSATRAELDSGSSRSKPTRITPSSLSGTSST